MTPEQAYYKAKKSGKRMPELELTISKNAYWSYYYARDVIKGRWELGEAVISKNTQYSYGYAIGIIKGRLPDFMHNALLLSNDEFAKEYVKFISKNSDSLNNKI